MVNVSRPHHGTVVASITTAMSVRHLPHIQSAHPFAFLLMQS